MTAATRPTAPASSPDGLNFACVLNDQGPAAALDWAGVAAWTPADGPVWVHLDRGATAAVKWLESQTSIPEDARAALLASETRPRAFTADDGMVVVLRGINQNAGSEADDMVAIRIWVEEHRIISLRHRRLMTPRLMYDELIEKGGPSTPSGILLRLADRLTEQMNGIVIGLDEQLDGIEERLEERNLAPLRVELADIRQSCVTLRR
jgi:zinc transporter